MARQARGGARRGGNPALRLAAIRRWHSYLGAFIAPSVLFFALTGSLQLFSLHEAHGGYRPLPVIEKLGNVHKDQVFAAKPKRSAPPAGAHRGEAEPKTEHHSDEAPRTATLALKWVFLFVAASLVVSTCLGLWMALAYSQHKGVLWLLVLLGAALPVALLIA